MTLVSLLLTHFSVCVFGYGVRVFIERRQRLHRERVLRALGGKLPDWEEKARALEARAHLAVNEMTDLDTAIAAARALRVEADITRRRGRRRDGEWT